MSSLSPTKFTENAPVTGIMAISQAAVGLGIGLLLADKMGRKARQRIAIGLIGAGAAALLPVGMGIVNTVRNRPTSSRRMRKQLESIRQDTGFSEDEEAA